MALIFEPFADSKLVFGCAQELRDFLGVLVALDASMFSRRLSAERNPSRMMAVCQNQESLTSYKTSNTLDWIDAWSAQLAV